MFLRDVQIRTPDDNFIHKLKKKKVLQNYSYKKTKIYKFINSSMQNGNDAI